MTGRLMLSTGATLLVMAASAADPPEWRPAQGPLMTRWARQVSPANVHPEYPRPQLARPHWTSLNGLWDYAIVQRELARPDRFQGRILVPFPVESALSGVMKPVGGANRLWYRRRFLTPPLPAGQGPDSRLLLHFGAVDWQCAVWVNGKQVGQHQGGYDPFTFDITGAVDRAADEQELLVSVWDPTDEGYQPRGKQVRRPRGIWYTAVTGIWQTVWLEWVPATYIRRLVMTPDVDHSRLELLVQLGGQRNASGLSVQAAAYDGDHQVAQVTGVPGRPLVLHLPSAKLWSPDSPFLYDLQVRLVRQADGRPADQVTSYFGLRKIEVRKDKAGFNRLFLNNQPLFQFGPLDQGWWPDGLYTAPTDEALRYDIEVTRRLGFNMCRKHVKVEPQRWYYWCDKLGLLVWQDMPSGDRFIGRDGADIQRSPESAANFRREYQALIDCHYNHPCVVVWVVFNEGWGQFDTNRLVAWTKRHDPTRLVDCASGWADRGCGDLKDMHRYPGPGMPEPEPNRAAVLGEFGGLGLPLKGHLWWDKRNWGYRTYRSLDELQQSYEALIGKLRPLIARGLAAAVYTQTTDVEGEVNGLMTYDRAVIKRDVARTAALHRRLYLPPPVYVRRTVLPTSERSAQRWRYRTERPAAGWQQPDFDDSGWPQAPGGFGRKDTPGAVVRTNWHSSDIWLRRTFQLQRADFHSIFLRVHHDEDAEVYINGRLAARLPGYTVSYEELELPQAAQRLLRQGTNTLAVHCHQSRGGQYIDLGLVDIEEQPAGSGQRPRP